MLRTVLIQAAIFAIPFAAYALYLAAMRRDREEGHGWTPVAIVACGAVALVLTAVSLVMVGQFSSAPPSATYEPPHSENGRIVPGRFR